MLCRLADGHAERSVCLAKRRRIGSIGEAHQTGHFFLGDVGRRAPTPQACQGQRMLGLRVGPSTDPPDAKNAVHGVIRRLSRSVCNPQGDSRNGLTRFSGIGPEDCCEIGPLSHLA